MSWISIVLWLLTNLPDLIALIRRLFNRTSALAPSAKEGLRVELSTVIQDKRLSRREKRLRARQIVMREESIAVERELNEVRGR